MIEYRVIFLGLLICIYPLLKLLSGKKNIKSFHADINHIEVKEFTERVKGIFVAKWYVVDVEYRIFGDQNSPVFDAVGQDKKSSWFARKEDAQEMVDKILEAGLCYQYSDGSATLIPGLSERRKEYYMGIIFAGLLIVMVDLWIKWYFQS